MLPPSCARCGAPLPAVAADPTHPEWCAACAARALDTPGTVPPPVPSASGRGSQAPWGNPTTATVPSGASLVVKTRVLDGILTGLAAATVAGALWWAVASRVDFEHWHLGSILVGLIVGQGVLIGSRRGGFVSGLLALVFTSLAVLAAVYFIDRSLQITSLAGRTSDISLWLGFGHLKDTYQGWYDFDKTKPIEWLLGPIVAVIVAGWPGRRPIIG